MEYKDIFSPKTISKLNKASAEHLRQMLGNKTLMQTLASSAEVLGQIQEAEAPYKNKLEALAVEMVKELYPIIDEQGIILDAKIIAGSDVNDTLDEITVANPNEKIDVYLNTHEDGDKYFEILDDNFEVIGNIKGKEVFFPFTVGGDYEVKYGFLNFLKEKKIKYREEKESYLTHNIVVPIQYFNIKSYFNEIIVSNPSIVFTHGKENDYRNFEKGKNVKITIINLLKVNPYLSEEQIKRTLANKFHYDEKTIGDNIRNIPEIDRKKVKNHITNRPTYVYFITAINENITPEARRRIINAVTQGAALRGAFAFYLFKEHLDEIDPTLIEKYNQIMKEVFGIYDDDNAIALMLSLLAQGHKQAGGSSKVIINEIIVASPGDDYEIFFYEEHSLFNGKKIKGPLEAAKKLAEKELEKANNWRKGNYWAIIYKKDIENPKLDKEIGRVKMGKDGWMYYTLTNEITVVKPSSLRIIKTNDNNWGLLANNEYLFGDISYHSSRPEIDKYKIVSAGMDIERDDNFGEYLNVYISEPSFGGGGTAEEIDEAYDEYEKDLATAERVLAPYSFQKSEDEDSYNIYLHKILNINLIPIINEITVAKPNKIFTFKDDPNYGIIAGQYKVVGEDEDDYKLVDIRTGRTEFVSKYYAENGQKAEHLREAQSSGITIQARAICFPMLVHELIKGLYELISLQGFKGADKKANQAIVDKVDLLKNEPTDIKYGKFIYDALNGIFADSNYEDPRIREFFFAEIYRLGEKEFIAFIENAINEELNPQQQSWVKMVLRDIADDLKADDRDALDEITVGSPTEIKFPILLKNRDAYNKIEKLLLSKGYEWFPDYHRTPEDINHPDSYKRFPSYIITNKHSPKLIHLQNPKYVKKDDIDEITIASPNRKIRVKKNPRFISTYDVIDPRFPSTYVFHQIAQNYGWFGLQDINTKEEKDLVKSLLTKYNIPIASEEHSGIQISKDNVEIIDENISEITIAKPIPKFKNNQDMEKYLEANNDIRAEFIKKALANTEWTEKTVEEWLEYPIENNYLTFKAENNSLYINDGDDNIIHFTLDEWEEPTRDKKYKIQLGPNIINVIYT